ncbi:hypothetical protein [Natronorubrum sp. DTA28]|uniref:hypothetical protein n=1 Tax=Natronorubrum sp. DTA28 TaxID=3447019 RepID=UPI003F83D8EA
MTNWCRRGVLCGTTGFLASVAGCQDLNAVDTESVDREPNCDIDCSEHDPETYAVRGSVRPVEIEDADRRAYWASGPSIISFLPRRMLVWSESSVDELAFADGNGADDAESFLRGTNYDESSAVLLQFETAACNRVELVAVEWTSVGITVELCIQLYGHDVECEVDREEWVTLLARIPDTLNPTDIDEFEVTVDDCRESRDNDSDANDGESDGTETDDDATSAGNETSTGGDDR